MGAPPCDLPSPDSEDDELAVDVSTVAMSRLISDGECLVDHVHDCCHGHRTRADEDEDTRSMAGTFVNEEDEAHEGDDDGDGDVDLLTGRPTMTLASESPDDDSEEQRPSLFAKRSDSLSSSFSLRETVLVPTSHCPCSSRQTLSANRDRLLVDEYLDANIRHGVTVRVVDIESAEMNSRFVLRVHDSESKKQWEVRKSTKEMAQFYNQIRHICMDMAPVKKEMWGTFRNLRKLRLPRKFLHSRGSLCYQRKVVYDSLLRHTAAMVAPAPIGPRRRQVLLLLQEFLDVPLYLDAGNRESCNCWFFAKKVNARQLVAEIFSDRNHLINKECSDFVGALVKKTHDTRRSRLYHRQANAILRTIAKKMDEVKKALLNDVTLLQQVGTMRQDMSEEEFDDFVDDVRLAAAGYVQRAILIELEDHVHEALHCLHAQREEANFAPQLKALRSRPLAAFGLLPHLHSKTGWETACTELRRMQQYALPLDKLRCIVRAAAAIYADHKSPNVVASTAAPPARAIPSDLTTDDFLQIFFVVVIRSDVPELLRTQHLLRLMCDPDDLTGELGYYFANLEATITLIERGGGEELVSG